MRAKLANQMDRLFLIFGIMLSLYLIATMIELFQEASEHYTTFLLSILILVSLLTIRDILRDESKGLKFWIRLTFLGLASIISIIAGIYLRYHAVRLETIQPFITEKDIIIGWFLIGSLLILNWVHWGTLLTIIIAASIWYFSEGHIIPSLLLGHEEFSAYFVMSYLGMSTTGGIFWFVPLAADSIFFLIIFAGLFLGFGALPLVMEAGKFVGNYVRGGAAFPAVIGSAAIGSVMGQAVSNTMLTGQLTIPMMKKNGYPPNFAGAIEAVASTTGQFLPPILGIAAFIMAGFLNIAYIEVALAATLTSLLKVATVFIAVIIGAGAYNLSTIRMNIDKSLIYRLLPVFLIPFGILFAFLLMYYSPNRAALYGVVSLFVIGFLFQGKKYRPHLNNIKDSFKNGLEISVSLSLLLIAIGPIAQMSTTTNLAGNLGSFFFYIIPHNLAFILLITMVIAMILGLGLPTPVAYLLSALTLAPFLQEFGVTALAAHLFVFYFAVFSTISPPVAISCLAACKISGGSFMGTTKESLRLALPSFFVPFVFIFNQDLLIFPKVTAIGVIAFLMLILLEIYITAATYGYFLRKLNGIERSFFAAISVFLIYFITVQHASIYGLALFVGIGAISVLWIFITKQRNPAM